MNRVILKRNKKTFNNYSIIDVLDGKKIGKLKDNKQKLKVSIKKKYNNAATSLKKEAIYFFLDQQKQWHSEYHSNIANINADIININYYHLPLFHEPSRLVFCEKDMFDRPAYLHPAASKAWQKMRSAATSQGTNLQIISAFRSIDYQKQLIMNKLKKGIDIKDIIKVSALPGFSEHHTGCAIDIGSQGASILEESFEQSTAFKWLLDNAAKFNFYLTYPQGNTTGICYEPWHWCYRNG